MVGVAVVVGVGVGVVVGVAVAVVVGVVVGVWVVVVVVVGVAVGVGVVVRVAVVVVVVMLTTKQLKERQSYIGGSDCAAVLGMSRWNTPLGVWAEKTGILPPRNQENLAMEVGSELEDLVCKLFEKRTGKTTQKCQSTCFHKKHNFIAANIDRMIVGENALLEAKTASGWKAKEWEGEDIPKEYVLQVMHQLSTTDFTHAYIAVLIGGNADFKWKCIPRDEKFILEITKKEVEFWTKFVVPKVMPTMITKGDTDILNQLFPGGVDDPEITLGDDANKLVDARNFLLEDKRMVEAELAKTDNSIKALLKEHSVAKTDKYLITWKKQLRRAHTVPESMFRALRVKQLNGKEE